jgi:FkbM family methyltransferase
VDDNLIFDVGMHTGRDTEFYLKKGFSVVSIEANQELARNARAYFENSISCKKLTICEVAIADHEGEIDFYVNDQKDDWGTISKEFASRNEGLGTSNTLTRVRCTTFQTILRQHGVPYYLKIDIEGADTLCLVALLEFEDKPKYISIETGLNSFEETFTELSLLWNLGYRDFKIVNQALNENVSCPNPPLEGSFVDYRFDGTCSGPFGEEAPGEWMPVEDTFARYRRILTEQKYFGAAGKLYRTPLHSLYEILKREPIGWYDVHAKLADSGTSSDRW